jgi:hypothetical protein
LADPQFRSALLLLRNQYSNTVPQMSDTHVRLELLIKSLEGVVRKD